MNHKSENETLFIILLNYFYPSSENYVKSLKKSNISIFSSSCTFENSADHAVIKIMTSNLTIVISYCSSLPIIMNSVCIKIIQSNAIQAGEGNSIVPHYNLK